MPASNSSVQELLDSIRDGDAKSFDTLFSLVYEELHRLARQVRSDRPNQTVNTTALVHEAYLKLAGGGQWEDRLHFMRTAARAMRHILIDQARVKVAQKRGGEQVDVTFDEELYEIGNNAENLLSLDEAIKSLEKVDPRMAQIVEFRYFAGLSVEETAKAVGVSDRTIKRDWRTARAFLTAELRSSKAE